VSPPHFDRNLLDIPIDVSRYVRIANDTEHPGCLAYTGCQFVGPVGDARPLRRSKKLFGGTYRVLA
jgi:hypothetical protein